MWKKRKKVSIFGHVTKRWRNRYANKNKTNFKIAQKSVHERKTKIRRSQGQGGQAEENSRRHEEASNETR